MGHFEDRLRRIYLQFPPHLRPPLKGGYRWLTLHASALAQGRSVVDSKRVEFLDYEIAHLEPFGFLSPAATKRWRRILALLDWTMPPLIAAAPLPAPLCPCCRKPMALLALLPRAPP